MRWGRAPFLHRPLAVGRKHPCARRVPCAFRLQSAGWVLKGLLERAMGFEPTTLGLGSRCSTAELHPLATPDYINPASASATSPSRGKRPVSALLKTFLSPALTTNLPPDDGTITTACRRSACSVRISSATRAACPSYPHSAQYSISTCTFLIAILPSTLADLECVTLSVPAGYVWPGSGGGRSTPVPGARARRSEEKPG